MVWELENNPSGHRELVIYKYIKKQTKDATLAHTISKFIDLHDYLESHPFKNAAELRKHVLSRGIPLFSKSESEQLFRFLEKTGGGSVVDNVVARWIKFMYEWQPSFIKDATDAVSPYVFILKTLEAGEFGPMFSVALDSVDAMLPVIAASIETVIPELIGFLPIPESGPVGTIIGWMFASVFVVLSMLVHLSRAHFGQAFMISFLLIPFLGTSLYNGALSGEKFVTKLGEKRTKMINTVSDLFGKDASVLVEAAIPDPSSVPEEDIQPETKLDLMDIGKKTISGLAESVGVHGGKRLSRRAHTSSKWQTRRRLKP